MAEKISKKKLDSVSQRDVAQLAGVSEATVSRVFTPGASVSDEMREEVLAAVDQLDYRPNAIARSLVEHSVFWSQKRSIDERRELERWSLSSEKM
ncbi:MAG: LacI family DNA-binding transcriptional regulator [Anaerolineales bacterium]|nr:LacI family DNA-binding transcriptional regulator [Anaerolineales bacterium]